MTTGEMIKNLIDTAKTGAKVTVERGDGHRLNPLVVMTLRDGSLTVRRLTVGKDYHLRAALESCLKHYDAHAYAFIKECDGTDFPEALLMAHGDFDLLAEEDKYRVLTLQACARGNSSIFTSRGIIEGGLGNRTVRKWEDERLEEVSKPYVTHW